MRNVPPGIVAEPLYSIVALPVTKAVRVSPMSASWTLSVPVTGSSVACGIYPAEMLSISNAFDVLLSTTPADAARIHTGAAVALVAGQSAGGESLGHGTVVDVGGAVDSATRSVAVRVRVTTVQRVLRIGETVFGEIATSVRADAIVVPVDALVPEGDGFKVFVVDAQNVAHERPVTVGARTSRLAEITAGLRAGEKVVTYGAYGVEDSAKVVTTGSEGMTP